VIQLAKPSPSANASDFRQIFILQAHRLLQLGYSKLDAKSYANVEEPDITGDLRGAMEAVIDDPNADPWLHFYYVEDEHHVNDGKRKGKRRKRVDIRITASRPRPRNHLSFEAKRLSDTSPIGDYLGNEGLGCFLSGDYAALDGEAGMLGYVQSRTVEDWSAALEKRLNDDETSFGIVDGIVWAEHPFRGGPPMTFHSRHLRKSIGKQIDIFHNLLVFYG
jgi:hypothetical protein